MKHLIALLTSAMLTMIPAHAYAQASTLPQLLIGNWQGTVTFGTTTTRVGLVVTPNPAGGYNATMVVIDQDGATFPVTDVVLTGNALHLNLASIKGTYDGTLSPNGQDITGTFATGGPVALNFLGVDKLDAVARSRTTREGLQSTDYAVSKAAQMSITPLTATSALVDIHWRRDKKDGSLFGEGAEFLVVLKTTAGWQIVGNIPRSLSQYGKRF